MRRVLMVRILYSIQLLQRVAVAVAVLLLEVPQTVALVALAVAAQQVQLYHLAAQVLQTKGTMAVAAYILARFMVLAAAVVQVKLEQMGLHQRLVTVAMVWLLLLQDHLLFAQAEAVAVSLLHLLALAVLVVAGMVTQDQQTQRLEQQTQEAVAAVALF
jgi:hypothetical protein